MKRLFSIIILAQLTFLNADNYSLSFDGVDDYVQTPIQNNSIIENNTITVSSWIYLEENNEHFGRYIMSNYPAYAFYIKYGMIELKRNSDTIYMGISFD